MDGDLLGEMAFAAPSTGNASQTQPMAPPTPAMDLLSGSPIKTKEQAPSGSSFDAMQNGQGSDGAGACLSRVSQLPFSDNPTEFETHQPSAPQAHQHSRANDLLDFPASSTEPTPSDLFVGARPFADDPQSTSDPFAPSTQQVKGDASIDPVLDQPMAPHTAPLASPANGLAPFSDQPPQSVTVLDLFAAPLPATKTPTEVANPAADPFSLKDHTDEKSLGAKASDLLASTSEPISAQNEPIENSGNANNIVPEKESAPAAAAKGSTITETNPDRQCEEDDHPQLDDATMGPGDLDQTNEKPLGNEALDSLVSTSELISAPNESVENSENGNKMPENEFEPRTVTEASVAATETNKDSQHEKDDRSKLDDATMAPESVQSPLETSSDKNSLTENVESTIEATAPQKQQTVAEPQPIKEVTPKEDPGPALSETKLGASTDPPVTSTPVNPREKDESSGNSNESSTGESRSMSLEPNKPLLNGSDVKSEKKKSKDSSAAPTNAKVQAKTSHQPLQPKPNATATGPEATKIKQTVKASPTIRMGKGNQKLDFGMASNMFRSFSSKGGAQLKQLQSKGGASLKVGLSRLGEASSNLADTIKQKNATPNVFKADEFPRPEKTQATVSQTPPRSDLGKKEAARNVNETSGPPASVVDKAMKDTVLEEKKYDGNAVENQQINGSKASEAPPPKDTFATSAITRLAPERKTSDITAATVKVTANGQNKESTNSESKGKDVKQGLSASTVTSLFGFKIEKIPAATTTIDDAKVKVEEEKKSVPEKVESSGKGSAKDTSTTIQPEKQISKEQHSEETKKKSANEALEECPGGVANQTPAEEVASHESEKGDAETKKKSANEALEERPGDAANQSPVEEVASQESEKGDETAQKDVESKATQAAETVEENEQEIVENPLMSEDGQIVKVSLAQGVVFSEQTAKFSARIAALEKELQTSKEGSSKQIQTLKEELQANKEGATKRIQTLQKELQASKDGSSRLIKSLEKKLHAAQETVKQLKEKSIKLQQGAEENELKKDLVENLNNRLQSEMGQRQEAESTAKKTKEKLDKVVEQFNGLQKTSKERLLQMKGAIDKLMQSNKKMEEEIVGIREERDEQGRRLSSYTTQLNEAKEKSAVKINAAEHYELKMNELDAELKKAKDKMAQIKFERDRFRKELGNWKKYAEDRNKQLEGQLNHEKKLNEERKRRMKIFVEAKTEEARSSNVDNVSLQAELDQTTRSLKDFNQRYKQLHNQWVQAQTRNRELQRDMAKMKNDSEKMSRVGGTLEAKLSRYSKEIEDHKSKRLAAKNELMTVIAKLEEEKKASTRLRDFVTGTMTPKILSQHQVLQESADHLDGGIRQLALRFGREISSLRRNPNGKPNPLADSKPKSLEEIQAMVGDANTARVLSKLDEEHHRVNEQISEISMSVEQLESLLVAPTTKGCVGAMFNF